MAAGPQIHLKTPLPASVFATIVAALVLYGVRVMALVSMLVESIPVATTVTTPFASVVTDVTYFESCVPLTLSQPQEPAAGVEPDDD